jgi:hypothetical protein
MLPGRINPNRATMIHCFPKFRQSRTTKKPFNPDEADVADLLFEVFACKPTDCPVEVVDELGSLLEGGVETVV